MTIKIKKPTLSHKDLLKYLLFLGIYTYLIPSSLGQNTDSTDNSLFEFVMSKTSAVEDPDKQVGSFDPNNAPSLPIGIVKMVGDTKYIICIDSAYFLPTGAYFSAYMALEFPGADKKIAFAAKDIKFNSEGIIGGEQSKLMLVSEHIIELGESTKLRLPPDGSNYVSWDCNGFESVNLKGEFILSNKIVIPVDTSQTNVIATFETNVQDLSNMLCSVNFTPFTVKGMEDFEFIISEASVDMSDYVNPPNVIMPNCYHETYPGNIELWRGFHLKYLEVQLPEKLSAHDDPTQIYAQNLFIDDAGVTGQFGANNVLALGDGDASGWGFSVDNIQVGLITNQLSEGGMAGKVEIPLMDNNALHYTASISKNDLTNKPDYLFTASPDQPMPISVLSSTLTIAPASTLQMSIKEEQFDPKLILHGNWQLNQENAKFSGIGFQDVTFITAFPYVTNGKFSLVDTLSTEMAKFNVSLNSLNLGINNGNVGMAANVGMNLSGGANSISVSSGFEIYANVVTDERNKPQFQFDRFAINTIQLSLHTNAFELEGFINFYNDDPDWGKGFKGGVDLLFPKIDSLNIAMLCAFGKVSGYRYWAVDVTAPLPGDGIKLGAALALTQVSGGLSYHMKNGRSVETIMGAAEANVNSPNTEMSSDYSPDITMGVGFSAGVSYKYAPPAVPEGEKLLNGEVVFQVQFNSNGGLSNILLAGNAYMLVKKTARETSSNYAKGTIAMGYDNQEKIFDMQMTANAQFDKAFTASIWSQLYISPDLWYFHLGTPDNRCVVNATNFVSLNAYFMLGQNLQPMPPPPPQVSSVLGGLSNGRNENAILNGNGICIGAGLDIGIDPIFIPVFNKWHAYLNAYFGVGFDLTMIKYADGTHCAGVPPPFGTNNWFMTGQIYGYGGLSAGACKVESDQTISNNFTVISASMAMLLQGKFPNPSYVYGGLYMQASVFNIFNLDITMDFDFGTDCQIVN